MSIKRREQGIPAYSKRGNEREFVLREDYHTIAA
jgi:hypothetical protein